MTRRTDRVGEEIRAELARLLREEATDPRIGLVTLTRVDLAPDFKNARVYWSCVERGGPDPAVHDATVASASAGLASAAPFLRRRLAQLLPTKRVPELRFRHDPSLALASGTLSLLSEINDHRVEPSAEEPSDDAQE